MATIRAMSAEQLAKAHFTFKDSRLSEMLFRYRARNFPDSLGKEEQVRWREFCVQRLTGAAQGNSLTLIEYFKRLQELEGDPLIKPYIFDDLVRYGKQKIHRLDLNSVDILSGNEC